MAVFRPEAVSAGDEPDAATSAPASFVASVGWLQSQAKSCLKK
jgi:hypothetical protein